MRLQRNEAPVNVTLAFAWAALMFLYIYNDYFNLYQPGHLANIAAGHLGPFANASPAIFLAASMLLAIPASMILISVVAPPVVSRWLNIVFGLVYTLVDILTFFGSSLAFQAVVVIETVITLTIVWRALRWPKET